VVAVSLDLKKQLMATGKFDACKLAVVHNGVPPITLSVRVKYNERKLQIGTAGRLVEVKDLNLFIDVAADVLREVSNICFRILGDGPLKQQLSDRVRELGLADTVVFEGYREDARAFYDEIDIYLNTSLHEGLPLSILEAMAKGRPVVAPMVGGIPEVISNGQEGFLIEGRDSKEFAAKCLLLIRDRHLLESMGNNAHKKIQEKFSSAQMTSAYIELYEVVMGKA
jgi:glycosyltransferase involved in cell wall biosynthesis